MEQHDVPGTLGSAAFDRAMEIFAPFEPSPMVAVAVSGGPDSMALALLLEAWTRRRGGTVLGLTVDHGLRPDSAIEACQVGEWLAARGIAHQVLRWTGDKPATGLQAAARRARYELLAEAAASRGILHLALAHHADDQAETVLFRRDRGSGGDGLAGMTACRSLGPARILRPLLAWSKSALVATCLAHGQPFFTDPSNQADRFARTGLRRRLGEDEALRRELLDTARVVGGERQARAEVLNRVLAAIAEVRPDGVVMVDRAGFARQDQAIRRGILSAVLRTAGGEEYAPSADAVSRLDAALSAGAFGGASLAGCVVRRWRAAMVVCREPARVGPPVLLTDAGWRWWDRRFRVRAPEAESGSAIAVGALGSAGYAALRRQVDARLPAVVGAGLPALRSGERLLAVPGLGWRVDDAPEIECRFTPLWPLTAETFTVV